MSAACGRLEVRSAHDTERVASPCLAQQAQDYPPRLRSTLPGRRFFCPSPPCRAAPELITHGLCVRETPPQAEVEILKAENAQLRAAACGGGPADAAFAFAVGATAGSAAAAAAAAPGGPWSPVRSASSASSASGAASASAAASAAALHSAVGTPRGHHAPGGAHGGAGSDRSTDHFGTPGSTAALRQERPISAQMDDASAASITLLTDLMASRNTLQMELHKARAEARRSFLSTPSRHCASSPRFDILRSREKGWRLETCSG